MSYKSRIKFASRMVPAPRTPPRIRSAALLMHGSDPLPEGPGPWCACGASEAQGGVSVVQCGAR